MILSQNQHVAAARTTDNKKQIEDFLIGGIFSAMLAICCALTGVNLIFGISDVASENRLPAAFPTPLMFTQNPPEYCKGIESFISDRFSCRHQLVACRNSLLYNVFGTSGSNEVLLGKDNFMFLSGLAPFSAQTHGNEFSTMELDRTIENFKAKYQWLKSHGIRYVLMLIPEKGTVYTEKLPHSVQVLPSESRLDALQKEIAQKDICTYFDAKEVLIKAKAPGRYLFRRYDSHWNEVGAILVLRKLFESLNLQVPPLQSRIILQPDGDLAKMLALGECFRETGPLYDFAHRSAINRVLTRKSPTDTGVKFAQFTNQNSVNDSKLFMIGDSFTQVLMKFIPELAAESSFKLMREFNPQELLDSRADIVIEEMVERHLYDLEFERCPQSVDLLHETSNKFATIGDGIGKPTFANFNDKLEIIDFVAMPNKSGIDVQVLWRAKAPITLDGTVLLNIWDKGRKNSLVYFMRNQDFLKRRMKPDECWVDTFELKTDDAVKQDMCLSVSIADSAKKILFVSSQDVAWSGGGVYLPLSQANTSAQFNSLFLRKKLCYAQN